MNPIAAAIVFGGSGGGGGSSDAVTDVKLNGVTIVNQGVANIPVENSLESDEPSVPLSAKQGKVLSTKLENKADLENGRIPLSQLPEFVIADVVEVDSYEDLPSQGQSGVIYYTLDDGKSYRWVGSSYVEVSQKANFYSLTIDTDTSTMGQLRTLINNINIAGDHVFVDLHSYFTDGYVCTVHMYSVGSVNHCQILDLLYHRIIYNPSGYSDSTLISTYCTTPANIWQSPRDVRVNGASVISNEVANIPIADSSTLGVIKVNSTYGINKTADNALKLVSANDAAIANKSSTYSAITPSNLDKAVMEGLGNNALTWSDAYKSSARSKIGAAASADVVSKTVFNCEMSDGTTKTLTLNASLT